MTTARHPPAWRGRARVLFAFDLAAGIDLDLAERLISDPTQRLTIRHSRRAPSSIAFSQPPLRASLHADPVGVDRWSTDPDVELTLFHFGAGLVSFTLPIEGPIASLIPLGHALYDHPMLLERARAITDHALTAAHAAFFRPAFSSLVEDYTIYEIDEAGIDDLRLDPALPALLRAETGDLSDQERDDARSTCVSYLRQHGAVIDWNAALTAGESSDDVRAVLEYANVELLEMRFLDARLDAALDLLHARGTRGGLWSNPRRDLARLARLQADATLLFEGVNNTLKLVGDQYLARVYEATARRLHLPEWDAAILRKLATLERMHEQVSGYRANLRMEVLEWIIIILIGIEIVLPAVKALVG